MPKEQGHFGERAARSTSKNAKDKSNSATLRASKGGTHTDLPALGDMNSRMLRCHSEKDSEKDSGYSEAGSDTVHTDVDDQRSSVSQPHRESNKSSNNNSINVNSAGHNRPAYSEVAPFYIIKNLVVKPSRPDQLLHGPLAWGAGWHNAKAPTQLLLIQQPTLTGSSAATLSSTQAAPKGQSKTGSGPNIQSHSNKNSYLPILNSYPRIAPHPRKESHESKSTVWVEGPKEGGSEGQSQSKRVCTEEEKREVVSTTSQILKPQQAPKEGKAHPQSQHKTRGGHKSFSLSSHRPQPTHASSTTQHKPRHCKQSSGCESVSSPSVSSSQTPSPPSSSDSPSSSSSSPPSSSSPSSSSTHSPYHPAPDSTSARQRRFLNTAEILNQSGLLAITLRTKELLKQNATTEREIAQLRQHTNLLCQVAQGRGGGGSESLDKLVQAMSKSGSYPDLDPTQLKALSSIQPQSGEEENEKDNDMKTTKTLSSTVQVVSLQKIDAGISPPSPLFAPSPNTEATQHDGDPLDLMSSVSFPRSVPEQGFRPSLIDKDLSDLTMLPESSTHSDFLL